MKPYKKTGCIDDTVSKHPVAVFDIKLTQLKLQILQLIVLRKYLFKFLNLLNS